MSAPHVPLKTYSSFVDCSSEEVKSAFSSGKVSELSSKVHDLITDVENGQMSSLDEAASNKLFNAIQMCQSAYKSTPWWRRILAYFRMTQEREVRDAVNTLALAWTSRVKQSIKTPQSGVSDKTATVIIDSKIQTSFTEALRDEGTTLALRNAMAEKDTETVRALLGKERVRLNVNIWHQVLHFVIKQDEVTLLPTLFKMKPSKISPVDKQNIRDVVYESAKERGQLKCSAWLGTNANGLWESKDEAKELFSLTMEGIFAFNMGTSLSSELFNLGITDQDYLFSVVSQLIERGGNAQPRELIKHFMHCNMNFANPANHNLADKIVRKLVEADQIKGDAAIHMLMKEVPAKDSATSAAEKDKVDTAVDENRVRLLAKDLSVKNPRWLSENLSAFMPHLDVRIFSKELIDKNPRWLLENLTAIMPHLDGDTLYEIAMKFPDSNEVWELLLELRKKLTNRQFVDIVFLMFKPLIKQDSQGRTEINNKLFEKIEYLSQKYGEGELTLLARDWIFYCNKESLPYVKVNTAFAYETEPTKAPNSAIARLLEEWSHLPENLSKENRVQMLQWIIFFDLETRRSNFSEERLQKMLPQVISIFKLCDLPFQYTLTSLFLKQMNSVTAPSKAQEQVEKILTQEHTKLIKLLLTPLLEASPDKDWEFLKPLNNPFFMSGNRLFTILDTIKMLNSIPVDQINAKRKFDLLRAAFTWDEIDMEIFSEETNETDVQKLQNGLVFQHLSFLQAVFDKNLSSRQKFIESLASNLDTPRGTLIKRHKSLAITNFVRLEGRQKEEAEKVKLIFKMFFASLLDSASLPPSLEHISGLRSSDALILILEWMKTFKEDLGASLSREESETLSNVISQLEFASGFKLGHEESGIRAHQHLLALQKEGEPTGSMILPMGIIGHAILVKIDLQETGGTLSVINTGLGATHISERFSKSRGLYVETSRDEVYSKIKLSDLSPKFFETLFSFGNTAASMDKVFAFLDEELVEKGHAERAPGQERTMQMKGTCAVRCVNVWLQEQLGKDLFREYDAFSSEQIKVAVEETAKKLDPCVKPILFPQFYRGVPDEQAFEEHLELLFAKGEAALERKRAKLEVPASWSVSDSLRAFYTRIKDTLEDLMPG